MNCSGTYTNSSSFLSETHASNEAFYKRLKQLYPCVEDVSKLPKSWSVDSKAPPLSLADANLGCYFRGNGRREDDDKFAAAVRTDHHIPPSCLLYYFEIKFISKGREGLMGLGLTSSQVPLNKLPGWARESYGYHADDGHIFNGDGRGNPFGPTFTTGDVIGCGYNLVEGKCFFTKNGLNLGRAFEDIKSNISFYPTIGLKTPGEEIKANFGQEDFVYDIEQDLRSLRKNMTLTISNYPISDFGNWQSTIHRLVQCWLLQNSYPNTAEAFTKSAKIECKENMQRIQQRNRIQQLVLNGRISDAIKLTNKLCPNLLKNNQNLLFALKCRQFIELISGAENDFVPIFDYGNNSSNSNGVVKQEANGDQATSVTESVPISQTSTTNNNGLNGMIDNNYCEKVDYRHSTSSSSIQDLMEVDQPVSTSSTTPSNVANVDANNTINNHHRNSLGTNSSLESNSLPLMQNQQQNKQLASSSLNGNDQVNNKHQQPTTDYEIDFNEQKFAKLIHFGQELSDYLQQMDKLYGKNETNERMLGEAISLIAFIDPKNSYFGKLLDPSEREPLSQLLNSSILKAEMGDSYRPPLEEVMNHLKKLISLNNSHGKWLVDKLY